MNQKPSMNEHLQNLLITNRSKTTRSNNNYFYAKAMNSNSTDDRIQYMLKITTVEDVTQNIQKRMKKIQKIQHQNIVTLIKKGFNKQKKQVIALSQFFRSSKNMQDICLKRQTEINHSQINSICFQIILAMSFLEQQKINHLRLNPSSILIILPRSQHQLKNPVVQICDFGICAEKQYKYPHFLHPQFFDDQNKISLDPYKNTFEKNIKYDFWALGALIYCLIKQKLPFEGKSSSFSTNYIHKLKNTRDPQKWLSKSGNNFQRRDAPYQKILQKCWNLGKQTCFQSWKQALLFIERKDKFPMERISIKSHYQRHLCLMFLLSQTLTIMKNEQDYLQMVFEAYGIKNNRNNLKNMDAFKKLYECLIKIIQVCHNKNFVQRYHAKLCILPLYKIQNLNKITKSISLQKQKTQSIILPENHEILSKMPLNQLFEYVSKFVVKMLMIFNQIKQAKNEGIDILSQIFIQFQNKSNSANLIFHERQSNYEDFLSEIYGSSKFKKMAIQTFGFRIPQYSIFS